jgi:ABC-type transport system involved in multi-copper enzyme maturation permease subunit
MLLLGGFVFCLLQFLAAIPWVAALTMQSLRSTPRAILVKSLLPRLLGGLAGATIIAAVGLRFANDAEVLHSLGRFYGAFLHLQLVFDVIVLVFAVLLVSWPRGGAVARAAFLEGVRQPMFWFLGVFGLLVLLGMPFIQYFTFSPSDELKMLKELGYDTIMLVCAVFAVLAASMSISEEIEGRTAITVMSKPVSRRQFLLGKFAGILMAAFLMAGLLSVVFLLILWYKPYYDREPVPAPYWLSDWVASWCTLGDVPNAFVFGTTWWFADAVGQAAGLLLGFCQVMVLLAIAAALATRLPMVVNIPICVAIYVVGHLTPIIAESSQAKRLPLVGFIAKLFDTLLPGFDLFNIGPVLARDAPPAGGPFAAYTGSVALYALLYTGIALVFGLILFEDRDLA